MEGQGLKFHKSKLEGYGKSTFIMWRKGSSQSFFASPSPPRKTKVKKTRVKIEFMKGLGEGVWEVWASWEVQGCPGWQIRPGETLLNIWSHVHFDQHLTQSRGFAFLTFESVADATAARDSLTDTGTFSPLKMIFLNTTQVPKVTQLKTLQCWMGGRFALTSRSRSAPTLPPRACTWAGMDCRKIRENSSARLWVTQS